MPKAKVVETAEDKDREETKSFIRTNAEKILMDCFNSLPMDKPDNFEAILDFIVEDVYETSAAESDGYFSHGDIIIAFRRFIENKA